MAQLVKTNRAENIPVLIGRLVLTLNAFAIILKAELKIWEATGWVCPIQPLVLTIDVRNLSLGMSCDWLVRAPCFSSCPFCWLAFSTGWHHTSCCSRRNVSPETASCQWHLGSAGFSGFFAGHQDTSLGLYFSPPVKLNKHMQTKETLWWTAVENPLNWSTFFEDSNVNSGTLYSSDGV